MAIFNGRSMGDKLTSSALFSDGETSVGEFWAWAYSDLMGNTVRPLIAEFLVSKLLNAHHGQRIQWDGADVAYKGLKIEVKSSAYVQSWHQDRLSKITFDIRPRTLTWDASANLSHPITRPYGRHADLYVFCLLDEKDKEAADPRKLGQWKFFVLPTSQLNAAFRSQKTLSLSSLQKVTQALAYCQLKREIDAYSCRDGVASEI